MEKLERYDIDWRGFGWDGFAKRITKYVEKDAIEYVVGKDGNVDAVILELNIDNDLKREFVTELEYNGDPTKPNLLYAWCDSETISLDKLKVMFSNYWVANNPEEEMKSPFEEVERLLSMPPEEMLDTLMSKFKEIIGDDNLSDICKCMKESMDEVKSEKLNTANKVIDKLLNEMDVANEKSIVIVVDNNISSNVAKVLMDARVNHYLKGITENGKQIDKLLVVDARDEMPVEVYKELVTITKSEFLSTDNVDVTEEVEIYKSVIEAGSRQTVVVIDREYFTNLIKDYDKSVDKHDEELNPVVGNIELNDEEIEKMVYLCNKVDEATTHRGLAIIGKKVKDITKSTAAEVLYNTLVNKTRTLEDAKDDVKYLITNRLLLVKQNVKFKVPPHGFKEENGKYTITVTDGISSIDVIKQKDFKIYLEDKEDFTNLMVYYHNNGYLDVLMNSDGLLMQFPEVTKVKPHNIKIELIIEEK